MKKLFFCLCAASAMLFTACSDEAVNAPAEGESLVTITAQLPADLGTRAFGDGTTAKTLTYAVYEAGQTTPLIVKEDEVAFSAGLTTTVNLRLANGKKYDLVFWADAAGAPYTFSAANKTVTVDYTAAVGQDEKRDAFFAHEDALHVTGTINKTIELRRPFAQLNIGATDFEDAKKAGFEATQTKVTVNNVYSTLNLLTGEVEDEIAVTYDLANLPNENFTVSLTPAAKYMSMDYLLVAADKALTNVEFTAKSTKNETITRSYANVPVQRNFRTNIYGNILTEEANFNIEIVPGFETPDYDCKVVATATDLAAAVAAGGAVKLTADVELPATLTIPAGKEVTIDLNGKKITNSSTQNFAIAVNGTVVIEGDGEVYGGSGHDNQAVHVNVGGKAIIKGGTFNVGGDANGLGNSCVESNGGLIEIYGGVFKSEAQYAEKYWVLNMNDRYDNMFKVYGGQFYNFDPSDTNTEPADHSDNFLAPGYKSVKISDDPVIYEVQPE